MFGMEGSPEALMFSRTSWWVLVSVLFLFVDVGAWLTVLPSAA